MTSQFKTATEQLYKTFSKYPFKSSIEGCPCCVSNTDKATLHSKQLRELEDEDLSYYAFKAMTTYGDFNDFKHYLPRIFELCAIGKLSVDTFIILGKLDYGNWLNWNEIERNCILQFLNSWWKYEINNKNYFSSETLIQINKLTKNLPYLLENWILDVETQGFKNFIELLEYNYHDLMTKNRAFEGFNEEERRTFKYWIKANSKVLEEAFFKHEKQNPAFAEKISNTLYMLERIEET